MVGIVKVGKLLTSGGGSTTVAPPVPEQDTGNQTSSNTTSDTATFTNTTVSGNGVIVCFALKGGRRVSTLTDNKGNTYVRVGFVVDNSDAVAEMWYAQSITGGASHTLTVTYDAAAYVVWGAIEVSRIKGGGFLDARTVATFARAGAGSSASVSVTSGVPRGTNEMFVAMLALAGGGADAGIDTPTNWTAITQFNNYDSIMAGHGAYRINGNATALTATWTNDTTTAPAAAIIAAFRAQNAISAGVNPPVNSVLPVITGTTTEDETLTASTGTWSNSPDSYTYQWKDDGVAISGATASTYVLTSSEVDATITVTVTAHNEGGSVSATSAGVGPVEAAAGFLGAFVKLSGNDTRDWNGGVAIPWTGTDDVDVGGWHDPSTNNTRLTVPSGYGITRVRLAGFINVSGLVSGQQTILEVVKNGTTAYDTRQSNSQATGDGATKGVSIATGSIPATAGDYFEVKFHSNGVDTSQDLLATDTFAMIEATHSTGDTYVGAVVTKTADATAVNASGGHVVTFDSETEDTNGWHDNVTNNTRLTVPSGLGITTVRLSGLVRVTLVGTNDVQARFLKNGAATHEGFVDAKYWNRGATADFDIQIVSPDIPATAGDYFELQIFSTDTSITVLSSTRFSAEAVSYSPDLSVALTASGTQTANFTSYTALTFDTETRDDGGWHESVTNPSRITVPSGYNISHIDLCAFANISGFDTSSKTTALRFRKNNSTTFVGSTAVQIGQNNVNGVTDTTLHMCAYSVPCQAGDYFEVFHLTTSDTSTIAAASRAFFARATHFEGST